MDSPTSNGRLRRGVARVLAVLAVAAVVVALVIVVGGSLGSSDGGGGDRAERRAEQRQKARSTQDAVYVVQPNDTLAGIAAETGVSVQELETLNPNIDPQALPSGAQLKLR
jgi:LysM repeat protein